MRFNTTFTHASQSRCGSNAVRPDLNMSVAGGADGYAHLSACNFTHAGRSMSGAAARFQVSVSLSSGRAGDPQDVGRGRTDEPLPLPYFED